ncbi:MAG: DUF308 domain-containing protein [Bryobacteraceae bacterium]|jgi:uncharacterized membrane protein HdeD (DUF308 family)
MIDVMIVKVTPEMIQNWGWILAFGVVVLLLGIAAIVRSFMATVVSMVFFGWVLVFASTVQLVDAFLVGKWAGFFLHLLMAILFGTTGLLMLMRPVISAEAATFMMSMFFLIAGLDQLAVAFWTHLAGWGWQAFNGIIALVMGGLILAEWPVSGLWVIGLFVGIDLIAYGWSWVALALDLHKI